MIIGTVGFSGSGKGTVGDILENDWGFIKESFAKPLKDAVSIIFNWNRFLLEGDTVESRKWRETIDPYWSEKLNKNITPRLVLQLMGTEAGRNIFGESLWTASLINRITSTKNYVITDVRFENEIKALRDIGAKIIRIRRDEEPKWFDTAIAVKIEENNILNKERINYLDEWYDEAPHIHRSEWDWVNTNFDYVINNNSTIENLKEEIKYFITNFYSGYPNTFTLNRI